MNEFEFEDGIWKHGLPVIDTDGNEGIDWQVVPITVVPISVLLQEWEDLVHELSEKEVKLAELDELYHGKEFDIVYTSDIDFKSLYGSTAEKVRKQHAKDELRELNDEISALELSIVWIKNYISLLREVIRVKQ